MPIRPTLRIRMSSGVSRWFRPLMPWLSFGIGSLLVLACKPPDQRFTGGQNFLDSLQREHDKGHTDIPFSELDGAKPEIVCLMAPYSNYPKPSPQVDNRVIAITRKAPVDDEKSWGILAIDDVEAGQFRYFALGANRYGLRGPWASTHSWLSECVSGRDAHVLVNQNREISLAEGSGKLKSKE